MKVTLVGGGVSRESGISQHTERLVAGLSDVGCAVQHHGWHNAGPHRLTRARRGPARPRGLGLVWWDPFSWIRVGLRARQADRVGLVWFTPLQAPALAVVGWIVGWRRVFAVVHNGRPHEHVPMGDVLTRLALRRCALLVVHVEAVVADLRDARIMAPVVQVPLPSQIDLVASPLPEGPLRLLHLGEVHRRYKGTDVLLEALAHLRSQEIDASLTIAGRISGETDVRAMVAALRLETVVHLIDGWVPDDQFPALLAAHHLVVLPYRSATTSGIVPVARSAGRPVVATRVGGLTEMVSDGVDGILCDPGDPFALAQAIERAWEQRHRLAQGTSQSSAPCWADVARSVRSALNAMPTTPSAGSSLRTPAPHARDGA